MGDPALPSAPIYAIGDVYGRFDTLVSLLRGTGLAGDGGRWTGGDATLWFLGDFTDRGPDGVGVIDLVMRLQREAAAAGGRVETLLGNHDALILGAWRFGARPNSSPAGTFLADWQTNGGQARDLERLTPDHVEWLTRLPAMARAGDRLLVHADATFYTRYGRSVDRVNRAIAAVLLEPDPESLDRLIGDFTERWAFAGRNPDGEDEARAFLLTFGGRQVIHGHTPISVVTGRRPRGVRGPLVYAGGLCVNIDGGLYLGGPGFVHRITS